jgi:hypothetical protein
MFLYPNIAPLRMRYVYCDQVAMFGNKLAVGAWQEAYSWISSMRVAVSQTSTTLYD